MKLSEISNSIKNHTTIRIKGAVDYSHIASKIEGEELQRANAYTKFPSKDGYYKITLEITEPDPKTAFIYDSKDSGEAYLAAYLCSRIYESKKEENKGKKFLSMISKGSDIRVFKKDAENKLHKVALNGNELAQGLEVEVECIFFETKYGAGVGINAVIITAPEIKIYTGNAGVKGYELAEDTISLPARNTGVKVVNDVASANGVPEETPVADVAAEVEVDEAPVGSTSAPSNENFDALLAAFKTNN